MGSNDLSSIFNRAITGKSEWPDKEEFLDVIYWLRQLVGLVLGLICGTFAVQGILLACNNFMLQEDVIMIFIPIPIFYRFSQKRLHFFSFM